jgi:antirestriction protein ArdC
MKNEDVYEMITEQIIEALKQDVIPWEKPWKADEPRSIATGDTYSGTNRLVLEARRMMEGYSSPFWGTFNQITEHDGRVNKEETSTRIVFCKVLERFECSSCGKTVKDPEEHFDTEHDSGPREDDLEEVEIPLLRYYNVFNLDQTTLTEEDVQYAPEDPEGANSKESCEGIVAGYADRPEINHGRGKAYYDPGDDVIGLPERNKFKGTDEYYFTLFHELTHSTGHEARLDREAVSRNTFFRDYEYGREELVAELGASFLGKEANLETRKKIENRAAYVQSWIQALEEDEQALVRASSDAQTAVDFILNGATDE